MDSDTKIILTQLVDELTRIAKALEVIAAKE